MASKLFVMILAGGSSGRFWPLSRKVRPKQLLSFFSDSTLLGQTLARLDGLVPRENVLILTNREQEKTVREIAPDLPLENIVAEPEKRDTAAAIALGIGWVSLRDPRATMIVLPADQLIRDTAGFQKTMRVAARAAEQTGELVAIGIKPGWACPGYGYIEMGKRETIQGAAGDPAVYEVIRFREKPNTELAESFFKQGHFRWNAGIFVWRLNSILSSFERHAPEFASFITLVHKTKDLPGIIAQKFSLLPKISIDYAVMEKAARVLTVEAAFDWDDIGSWTALEKHLAHDPNGNASNTQLTAMNSNSNIVFSKDQKHVALLGVRNLIVVQTGDAILVCNRNEAEKIKNLAAQIPEELQ